MLHHLAGGALGRRRSGACSRRRRARCRCWRCCSCRSRSALHAALPVGAARSVVAHDPVLQHKALVPERAVLPRRAPSFYFAVWIAARAAARPLVAASRTRRGDPTPARALQLLGRGGLAALRPDHHLRVDRLGDVARAALVLDDLRRAVHGRPGARGARLRDRRSPRCSPTRRRSSRRRHGRARSTTSASCCSPSSCSGPTSRFSQFLIIWSGNLPEEIPWYLRRIARRLAVRRRSSWSSSTSPCRSSLLLSRDLKRNARRAARSSRCVLAGHALRRPLLAGRARRSTTARLARRTGSTSPPPLGVGGLWLCVVRPAARAAGRSCRCSDPAAADGGVGA